MKCIYINLASATERRRSIETSFAETAPSGWELIRLEAVEPPAVASVEGQLTPGEKACFHSHCEALRSHLEDEDDVLIIEDDMLFTGRAFAVVEWIRRLDLDWDILYLEVTLNDVASMVSFAKQRNRLVAADEFLLPDLSEINFASAATYLVRGAAKQRLLAALTASPRLDVAYDIRLRQLSQEKTIRARFCFPFLTFPSRWSIQSQIQSEAWHVRDRMISAFKRLMCIERDMDVCREDARYLADEVCDESSRLAGAIFASIVSDRMPDRF